MNHDSTPPADWQLTDEQTKQSQASQRLFEAMFDHTPVVDTRTPSQVGR